MRGHTQLIDMRQAGKVPNWVFLETDPDPLREWADWERMDNTKASLLIEPTDKRLDLRCVIDLKCFVQGEGRARVHEIRDACIAAGAKRVIAAVMRRIGEGEYVAFRTEEITDTAGLVVTAEPIHG